MGLASSIFINILKLSQNNCHFSGHIFKCISMNEKFCILICISLKFVPKGPFDNKTALVQVMAWCQTFHKPLPELMLTQITDAYIWHQGEMS